MYTVTFFGLNQEEAVIFRVTAEILEIIVQSNALIMAEDEKGNWRGAAGGNWVTEWTEAHAAAKETPMDSSDEGYDNDYDNDEYVGPFGGAFRDEEDYINWREGPGFLSR